MKWRYQLTLLAIRTKFKILSAFSKKKAAAAAFKLFCTPPSRHNGTLSAIFQDAEEIKLQWQQFAIRGFRWNKQGNRKVLIVHGFQSSAANFESYVQPLINKGMEVWAFDAPAHGGSSGNQINALVYCNFLRHIAAEYGPFNGAVAHSLGGLALCLALDQWPTKTLPVVALIAPATETRTAIEQYYRMINLNDKKVQFELEKIILSLSGNPVSWFSIGRTMATASTKFLWVHDEGDEVTPISDAKKVWEQNFPYLKTIITTGLGHRRIYRDEKVRKQVINFLASP